MAGGLGGIRATDEVSGKSRTYLLETGTVAA